MTILFLQKELLVKVRIKIIEDNKSSRITIRKSNALRIKHKAKHINDKDKANIYDARQMITYVGICKYANCFKWFYNNICKNVVINQLRNKISKYDKEHNVILNYNIC